MWERKKKREFKNPSTRRKVAPTGKFFVKKLPRDFYLSVQFCVGFALSGFLAVFLYKLFFSLLEAGLARGPNSVVEITCNVTLAAR